MKVTLISLLLLVCTAFSGVPEWRAHSGRFATFQTLASMKRNSNKVAADTIMEAFESPDISLTFDSDVATLPTTLQEKLERTINTWSKQRKNDWARYTHVENGGAVAGSRNEKIPDGMPFYLYLGFSAEENMTFAIHIRFRNLVNLNDVERILKSMKLKAPKDYKPLNPPRDPSVIPGLDPIPEDK